MLREIEKSKKEKYLEYQKEYRNKHKAYWKNYRQKKISNFVYMLLDNRDNIIYCGSTTDLYNRIINHKKTKKFSRVIFVEYPNLDRNSTYYIEQRLLEVHEPILNIRDIRDMEVRNRRKLDLLAEEFLYAAKDYK